MELEADFKLLINGNDVTPDIKDHILSLEISDEFNKNTDELSFTISGNFKRPSKSDKIDAYVGHKEQGLFYCGSFFVQSSERADNLELIIRATSVDFGGKIKEKRSQSYASMNMMQICSFIAKRNGLELKTDLTDDMAGRHKIQKNESDLSFLQLLAKEKNAIFAIKNGCLIFLKNESPSIEDEKNIIIDIRDAFSSNITHSNKAKYNSFKVTWRDVKENSIKEIKKGYGDPELAISGNFSNEASARVKLESIERQANAESITGHLKLSGQEVFAGITLILTNCIDEEDNGAYRVTKVTHSLTNGFTTSLEFTK